MANSTEEDDFWEKKRRKIKENIGRGISARNRVLELTNGIRGNMDQVTTQANYDIEKLKILNEIYSVEDTKISFNPVSEGSVDSLYYYSQKDAQTWNAMSRNYSKVKTQTDMLVAHVNASGTMVPSMVSGTRSLISERTRPSTPYYQYTEKLSTPSSQDRRNKLREQLVEKKLSFLANRLEGAWQTLHDRTKSDRISQASTSFRELITGFLNEYAPHKDVKKAFWYEQDPTARNATRKQRIRYAIMGNNRSISGNQFEIIIDLVDNLINEYDRLNKTTHLQQYEKDLEVRTQEIFDQCQIHMLKLIELNEKYFLA